jgi:hypothetical protein
MSSIWPDILQLPAVINMARFTAATSCHQYGQMIYSSQLSSIWPDDLELSAVINMARNSTAASSHHYDKISTDANSHR